MAQAARDKRLDRRDARARLAKGKRYYKGIGEGLTLVYRRTGEGFGTWSAKVAQADGKYVLRVLGGADDSQDGNGVDVLTFFEAQEKARGLAHDAKQNAGVLIKPSSVAEAAEEYMTWNKVHRRAWRETQHSVNVHILPTLGAVQLDALTQGRISVWLDELATARARVRTRKTLKQKHRAAPKTSEEKTDEKRARKATANRVLNVLKAILNRAFQQGRVTSDSAWRRVKPFSKVDQARIRFLTDAEGVRLVNSCPHDLRALVNGALLTGARFGELAALQVQDTDVKGGRIYIARSKSGKPRFIPLNPEGAALFRGLVTGRAGTETVFTKADGTMWGKNHHVRALAQACKTAEIKPAISFHELRHTYASHLAQAGVDLLTISKLLGHADTRITSKHYAHLADKTLSDAVTKLPSFQSEPHLAAVPKQIRSAA